MRLSDDSPVRRNGVRIALALLAFLSLTTFAPARLIRPIPLVRAATISFTPIPLDREDQAHTRLGPLVYRGGWEMRSDNPRFGGISALHVADGQATGLSDAGWVIRFQLPRPGKASVSQGSIDMLVGGPGSPNIKSDRDSESMTIAGAQVWIGFERRNAIWRYALDGLRSQSHASPKAMAKWQRNAGPEAIVRLPSGRFLVFSEHTMRNDGTSDVLLFDGDPAVPGTQSLSLGYKAPEGYDVTDGALLPDGRLLLLNRRFTIWEGVSAKLVVAPVTKPMPDAVISGEEIATFRAPINIDNMEGLSITRENGRTMLWLASDDNYNPLQRSLLLKFELLDR